MKYIDDDTVYGNMSCVHELRISNIIKMLYYSKQPIELVFYQNPNVTLHKNGKKNPKICLEP